MLVEKKAEESATEWLLLLILDMYQYTTLTSYLLSSIVDSSFQSETWHCNLSVIAAGETKVWFSLNSLEKAFFE